MVTHPAPRNRTRRGVRRPSLRVLGACAAIAWGCGAPGSPSPASDTASPAVARGFVELSAWSYAFQGTESPAAYQAPAVRLFYRYVRTEAEVARERLCVFLGGGPGLGNERAFLDWASAPGVSLTRLCNVLLLDSRNTGLSYQLVDAPLEYLPGVAEYNAYVDALDHGRAVAQLVDQGTLKRFTELLVIGESYGGVRATLLLNSLLYGVQHSGGPSGLVADSVNADLDLLRSGEDGAPIRYRQVLIQPTLAGEAQDAATGQLLMQPDSVVWQLAQSANVELAPCAEPCDGFKWMLASLDDLGRSPYDTRTSSDWLDRELDRSRDYAGRADGLLKELQAAPLSGLAAVERTRGFRVTRASSLAEEAPLVGESLGQLGASDRYFVTFNTEAFDGLVSPLARSFHASAFESSFGGLFLENVASVPTFITRAEYDLINYSPALAPLLQALPGVREVTLNLTGAAPRPGHWEIVLEDGARRVLRAPAYEAGHSVVDARAAVLDDLERWLVE
jgi:hypothetical protein